MKRWIVYTAGFIITGIILTGGYLYWSSDPSRHFEYTQVPVLVKPDQKESSSLPLKPLSTQESLPQEKALNEKEKKSFNVLVLGIDSRDDEVSRSDVIMVVHVIPSERKANIISLPRDTRVNISGIGYTKINHAHILGELEGGNHGGTEKALEVVSNFLEVPINYYVKTNFKGFKNFIDTIGGVDIHIEKDIYLRPNKKQLLAGEQHIDGDMALSLVRERWAFTDGDFGRQTEQSKVLKSVIKELLAPEHIIETAAILPKVRADIIDTNFTDSDIVSLIRMFSGMTEDEFQYAQIPGQSGYDTDPIVQTRLYYWYPDMAKVKEISAKYLN